MKTYNPTVRWDKNDLLTKLHDVFPGSRPFLHPTIPGALILPGVGPLSPDYTQCGHKEVWVNRLAAENVLKGAHVFAPGLLGCSPGVAAGDLVAVAAALEQPGSRWSGLNRGQVLSPELLQQLPHPEGLYLGVGRAALGRRGMFSQQQGLVVEVMQRVFEIPACNGLLPGLMMLQALPCIVAAQALNPSPGSRVLDMCAAPGGKTCMLAELMGDSGEVVALDRTATKAAAVSRLAADMGLNSITAHALDATLLFQSQSTAAEGSEARAVHRGRSTARAGAARDADLEEELAGRGVSQTSSSSSSSKQRHGSSNSSQEESSSSSSSSSSRGQLGSGREFLPGSFDHVLLDAPCSALGLRPRLLLGWNLPQLQQLAAYQRALLHSAVHMLRPGGTLLYCTCTINPGENEGNVRYALDKWPELQLVEQQPHLGGPGLVGKEEGLLTQSEAQLVQRFDPGGGDDDTLGFFIAKFALTKTRVPL